MTGSIWCVYCGYHVENKEIENPFIKKDNLVDELNEKFIKTYLQIVYDEVHTKLENRKPININTIEKYNRVIENFNY